jgi:hypothetical protein
MVTQPSNAIRLNGFTWSATVTLQTSPMFSDCGISLFGIEKVIPEVGQQAEKVYKQGFTRVQSAQAVAPV